MKERAECYRIGLLYGLYGVSEVVAWCDETIMAEASPDVAIIEASLAGSRGSYAVAEALSEVAGEAESSKVLACLFGVMHDLVERDRSEAPRISRVLYRMANDRRWPTEAIYSEMMFFDDAFDIALDSIYGNVEDITNELLQFLRENSTKAEIRHWPPS